MTCMARSPASRWSPPRCPKHGTMTSRKRLLRPHHVSRINPSKFAMLCPENRQRSHRSPTGIVVLLWLVLATFSRISASDSASNAAANFPWQAHAPQIDATALKRADALLRKMTLEEKIGQMVLFTYGGTVTGPTGERSDLESLIRSGNCGNIFNAHSVSTIRALQKLAVE